MVRITDGYSITREPVTLLLGIVGIVFGLFYIIHKYDIVQLSFRASDTFYLYFFSGYAIIAGIVLVYKATRQRFN